MSYLIENSFSSYKLSDEEAKQGAIFTITQKQVLQNLMVVAAEEKLALVFDPLKPQLFLQQEASLAGQIGILRYILDTSIELERPESFIDTDV